MGSSNDLVALMNAYLNGRVRRRELTTDTARRHRTVIRSFVELYGRRAIRNMSRRDIERWIERRGHLAPGTVRNDINHLRSFITWLQRERHLQRHPMLDIRPPKVPRSVPRALVNDEVQALWNVLPDLRARAIVVLMLGLGLRRAEVLRLQVGDWDRRSRSVVVLGKGGHQRRLPLLDEYAVHLDRYLDSIGAKAGPLIRTEDGRRGISNSWLGKLMRAWMEEAGVKHAPHDGKACHALRHTAASDLADVEDDLRVVQEFLGHTSLATTQVYLRRVDIGKIRAAMEARQQARTAA